MMVVFHRPGAPQSPPVWPTAPRSCFLACHCSVFASIYPPVGIAWSPMRASKNTLGVNGVFGGVGALAHHS